MSLLTRFAPVLFVLLWSTGFVGAKYGLPYAEPFWFLTVRFTIASGLLLLIVVLTKAALPRFKDVPKIALAGLLIHA